ncbi:type VI secretion system protein TssL, short form [Enterobacteriaceae bacterium ESL0689]|nr:type VI secretion system protein TssL, short form [Enterobacteriaceae bacterium ESL0689]
MKSSLFKETERIFSPGWRMVTQLRIGQPIHDGEALYRRACELVEKARVALSAAGFSDSHRDIMVYALCALLDESVMNRGTTDDGYLTWHRDPLQARFFGTLNAGEELWQRIGDLLNEPAADPVVLTCLYRTLQLGFTGRYRTENNDQREATMRALAQKVPVLDLSQSTPVAVRTRHLSHGRGLYWSGWIASVIALAALWLFLSSSLTELVSQTINPG